MTATLPRFRRFSLGAALLLGSVQLSSTAAHALPFNPSPSAFQRWLNSRNDWPFSEERRFEGLAECSDQTPAMSPYRITILTCIKGTVTLQRPGQAKQQCEIQRVSYFPSKQRVRLWTSNCR
jgi:hypothetical protein